MLLATREGTAPPVAECSLTLLDLDTRNGMIVPYAIHFVLHTAWHGSRIRNTLDAICRRAPGRTAMRRILSMLVLALSLSALSAAHADPLYDFTFTGGGQVYEFQLPDFAPAKEHRMTNYFGAYVDGTFDGTATPLRISFTVVGYGPQDIVLDVPLHPELHLGLYGPKPYTLTETPVPPSECGDPYNLNCPLLTTTFVPGTYQYRNCCTTVFPVTLTVTEESSTVTPEPGTLWLLGTGALGALAEGRRRFRRGDGLETSSRGRRRRLEAGSV